MRGASRTNPSPAKGRRWRALILPAFPGCSSGGLRCSVPTRCTIRRHHLHRSRIGRYRSICVRSPQWVCICSIIFFSPIWKKRAAPKSAGSSSSRWRRCAWREVPALPSIRLRSCDRQSDQAIYARSYSVKFDVFCEVQLGKPFPPDHERKLIFDTIEEARAADKAGFEIWWQVEHHGAPEFSYSAAPELLLTAIALNTHRIHVGHAGVLAPFRINGPLRVAERAATLDILSNGRFELGLAKSGGKEWETFGVDPETARDELREALQMIPQMWSDKTFGWNSQLFQMPEREIVPRPLQKPHPRLWQTASSPDSFRMAGELGVGVLGTTLLSPVSLMKALLDEYDAGLASCKKPAGHIVNPEKGVFTFVHVAESRKKAIAN